jgi:hypothetical protein
MLQTTKKLTEKQVKIKKDVNVPYWMSIFRKGWKDLPGSFFLSTFGLNPNQYGNFKAG